MNDYPIVTDENGVPRAPVPPSLVTVTRVVYALHALSILIGVITFENFSCHACYVFCIFIQEVFCCKS